MTYFTSVFFNRLASWICAGMCAALVGGCVVPFEHHLDASAAGYLIHGADSGEHGDGGWAVETSAGAGVGLGCRDRDWSLFLRTELSGGYDDELSEPYGALRLGAGYRHKLGAVLFETSATAGPVVSGWGSGRGGVLAAGFGLQAGPVDEGSKYSGFKYLMIEAVVDVRTLQRLNEAYDTERVSQLFLGIRLRSLLRRLPPCDEPGRRRVRRGR